MCSWDPVDIYPEDILIRRFRASMQWYLLHQKPALTIFQRAQEFEKECSVYTNRLMRRDQEWCAGPIPYEMAAFGFEARIPMEGYDDTIAVVRHAPDLETDAFSHTTIEGLDDVIADTMAEEGSVIQDYAFCSPNIPSNS